MSKQATGAEVWSYETDDAVVSSPAVSGEFMARAKSGKVDVAMGEFEVELQVHRYDPVLAVAVEGVMVDALVDTGASDSVLPASLLRGLGIEPIDTVTLTLADNTERDYERGIALFTYGPRSFPCPVVFGDEGVVLMGATTLESLKLIVDPVDHRLIPKVSRARPF